MLSSCHGHEKSQGQRIQERFKFKGHKNKTRLCDSKTKTKNLRIKTQDVQNKRENKSLLCQNKHKYEKNMTRLCYKIMLKTSVEDIERNERFYFYLYPFMDLAYKSFQGGFYVCIE